MPDELEPKLRPDSACVPKQSSKFLKAPGEYSEMSEELDPVLNTGHLKQGNAQLSKFASGDNVSMGDELEPVLYKE